MAKIDLPKGTGKMSKVRENTVKGQGILKRILCGNPPDGHGSGHLELFWKIISK